MKKNIFGRQFKRDTNERKALFKNLATSLVLQERIETTEQKAKAMKSHVDRLVTKAKKGGVQAERLLQPYMHSDAVKKMLSDIAPRFQKRPGGYTRILKIGNRFSDNAQVVMMEWVEKKTIVADASVAKKAPRRNAAKVEATAKVETPKKESSPRSRSEAGKQKKEAIKKVATKEKTK